MLLPLTRPSLTPSLHPIYARKEVASHLDKAVWEQITQGRAGIRSDNVERICKGLGGDRGEVLSIEKFGGQKHNKGEGGGRTHLLLAFVI